MIRIAGLARDDAGRREVPTYPDLVDSQHRHVVGDRVAPSAPGLRKGVAQARSKQAEDRVALRRVEVAAEEDGRVGRNGGKAPRHLLDLDTTFAAIILVN